jgi:hypothetical protein
MPATKTINLRQTETDIAVLQVKVSNIEKDVCEIKNDLKDVVLAQEQKHAETHTLLKDMQDSSVAAHKSMAEKINALEKWRWMLMGAGVVIGSLGYDTVGKLLK